MSKKFVITLLIISSLILLFFAFIVVIIDPYFHYRKPSTNIAYILDNERYQNDGIIKHFDYNAIITGTSMVENFKVSEFNKLFNVNSIKIPFAGAMFKEINDNLITATNYNDNIKIILRCLDLYKLNEPKDAIAYNSNNYPKYLYDDNKLNDINYLLNKNAITNAFESIIKTATKQNSTSFDDYASWYNMSKKSTYITTQIDYKNAWENIKQNVTDLADKYPNIDFYLFYPPYSIYYWDNANQEGVLNMQLDCIQYVTELLLEHKNIYIYSFLNEYDIITDLNNYKDIRHYSEKINSFILKKISTKDNLLTKDNYKKHIEDIKNFYLNYDYESLFK